jgi:hypothetical protein
VNLKYQEEMIFYSKQTELEAVDCFRYLGHPLVTDNTYWPKAILNIGKPKSRWAQASWILMREEMGLNLAGYFYKTVAQSVLIYGAETWAMSLSILKVLEGFSSSGCSKANPPCNTPQPRYRILVLHLSRNGSGTSGLHPIHIYMVVTFFEDGSDTKRTH